MTSAYPSIIVPFAFMVLIFEPSASAFFVVELVTASRLTIASWRILCIPKKRNIRKLSSIICWVGGRLSSNAAPAPVSALLLLGVPLLLPRVLDGEEEDDGGCVRFNKGSVESSAEEFPPISMSAKVGLHMLCEDGGMVLC